MDEQQGLQVSEVNPAGPPAGAPEQGPIQIGPTTEVRIGDTVVRGDQLLTKAQYTQTTQRYAAEIERLREQAAVADALRADPHGFMEALAGELGIDVPGSGVDDSGQQVSPELAEMRAEFQRFRDYFFTTQATAKVAEERAAVRALDPSMTPEREAEIFRLAESRKGLSLEDAYKILVFEDLRKDREALDEVRQAEARKAAGRVYSGAPTGNVAPTRPLSLMELAAAKAKEFGVDE